MSKRGWFVFPAVGVALVLLVILAVVSPYRVNTPDKEVPVVSTPTATPLPIPTATPGCVTGEVTLVSPGGFLFTVGETSLCGQELHWKDVIVGPDYDTYITALENELARWKDCVWEGLCPEYMRRPR